jgi:superfamily II DNA/RNA helicase
LLITPQVRMDVTRCQGGKLQVLEDIYCFLTIQQSIVFVERRKEADTISAMMNAQGFDVSTLHGELAPADRDRVMQTFRNGQSKVRGDEDFFLLSVCFLFAFCFLSVCFLLV